MEFIVRTIIFAGNGLPPLPCGAVRGWRTRRLGALLVAVVWLGPAAVARAEDSTAYTGVTGAAAALCTLVYAPLKLVYATGGTLVSGLAWIFTLGDTQVAGPIARGALRGDYVVTPAQLEGREALHFDGRRF
jgi:hypothetical protein